MSIPSPPADKKGITDQTFGRYHENIESDLILITMTADVHAQLTELKPVPIAVDLPPRYAEFIERLHVRYGLKRVANWPLPAIDIFCVIFQVNEAQTRDSVILALAQEPEVETVQAVQTFDTQSQYYNDPFLSLQHGVRSIDAVSSHQWSRGAGVRIAVIDTGMDNTHAELKSTTEATRNFVDTDEAAFRTDLHGTAIGGIIAANTNNHTGMVGIAPDASLLSLKACWQSTENKNNAVCNSLTLAKALNYSIQQKVDIINLSLTGPPDPVLERLVIEALARNIVVVGAMPPHGNSAFPISIPGTIAVAMPDYSSQTLTAPGRRVLSTRPNEQYDFFDGSSFSTAHISGLAALVRSLSPQLTPAELLELLMRTANSDTGAVNACRAVIFVQRQNNQTSKRAECR